MRALLLLAVLGPLAPTPAQEPQSESAPDAALADLRDFEAWLRDYRSGAFRLTRQGEFDQAAHDRLDALMGRLAAWNNLEAAQRLFEAAWLQPEPPGAQSSTERVDFYRELQPWKVQALARKHLCRMDDPRILDWLLSLLSARGIRAAGPNDDQARARAVLRILGEHRSPQARLELLVAARSMPAELRVQAVNALAAGATLEGVPQMLELLRDAEPNVRIAAATALGSTMAPHVDESRGADPQGEMLARRDQVIEALEGLLLRDRVWQVRSAAAFALAGMKCKPVIPALIRGLEAELKRKKDPWAMDMRLHKLLVGLTGQAVLPGDIRSWKTFWKKEGPTFAVAPQTGPGAEPPAADNKYQKFFDLQIESDRVLFVLDFSGSMAEPVTLKGRTTGAQPGKPITKAELVVSELQKIVMALPDGAMLNLVVFSDEVRVWRQERDGRPSLVRLDDETRDDLLGNFLPGLRPQGPTNLYGALDLALDFGGRGLYDKYYAAGFDTLYVLSDGAPSWGEITDKDEIRRRVREANGLRKITIHSVTFGDQNDTEFLAAMARENGGRHIHVE